MRNSSTESTECWSSAVGCSGGNCLFVLFFQWKTGTPPFFFGWLCFYGNDSKRERERERERKRSGSGRPTKKSSRNESVRLSTAASSLVLRFFLNLFSAHPFSFRQKKKQEKEEKNDPTYCCPVSTSIKEKPGKKIPVKRSVFLTTASMFASKIRRNVLRS